MCKFNYNHSFKKFSNRGKIEIRASREGKNPASCTLVSKPNKTLIIVTPWKMSLIEAGKRVNRISRFYSGYTIIPVSLPMGAV